MNNPTCFIGIKEDIELCHLDTLFLLHNLPFIRILVIFQML